MLPWRPCSARLRLRLSVLTSSVSTFGSKPGPFGLRLAGGTGGSLDILLSFVSKPTPFLGGGFLIDECFRAAHLLGVPETSSSGARYAPKHSPSTLVRTDSSFC